MALISIDYGNVEGGGGTVNKPDLIWSNPSDTTGQSAQTITSSSSGWVSGKNLADYQALIFDCRRTTTTNEYQKTLLNKSDYDDSLYKNVMSVQETYRTVSSWDTNGIGISVGSGASTTNCIVSKIYGLKSEVK